MPNTSTAEDVVETDEVDKKPPAPAAETNPDKEARRIKIANKNLQKERDDLKVKLDKILKDAEDAKLSDNEKLMKAVKEKDDEVTAAKAEAAKAKAEREYERKVSVLVSKHKLVDPEYGDLVLKGYNPEEHEDFDAFVAEAKKKPAIARLFTDPNERERIVDEDGNDVVPKISGSSGKVRTGGNWEEKEREIAESLYPNNKTRQDAYILGLKKLKGAK